MSRRREENKWVNNDPSRNSDLLADWQAAAPLADSLQAPPRFRLFSRQEMVVGASIPPWQHNKAAIVGLVLGCIGLVLCIGRVFDVSWLVAPFIVFGFPVSLVGIIVSSVSCRRPFRKITARWGLVCSVVAFILFLFLAPTSHLSNSEAQGTGLLIGSVLVVIEVGGFGGFGALMLWGAFGLWWQWLRMLWGGVSVEGSITERHTKTTFSRNGTRITSYFIRYEYRCGGEGYTHEQRVTRRWYTLLDEGRTVAVRCRRSNPKVACLAKLSGTMKEVVGSLLLFLFGVCWLGFSLFFVIMTIRTFPWGG